MTVREFMSPGYPNPYDINLDEKKFVKLTDSSRTGFRIEIVDYQLEKAPENVGGCYDYFMIKPISTVNNDDISSLASPYLNVPICGEMGDEGILMDGRLITIPEVFEVRNLASFELIFHSDEQNALSGDAREYKINVYELCPDDSYGDFCNFYDNQQTNNLTPGASDPNSNPPGENNNALEPPNLKLILSENSASVNKLTTFENLEPGVISK